MSGARQQLPTFNVHSQTLHILSQSSRENYRHICILLLKKSVRGNLKKYIKLKLPRTSLQIYIIQAQYLYYMKALSCSWTALRVDIRTGPPCTLIGEISVSCKEAWEVRWYSVEQNSLRENRRKMRHDRKKTALKVLSCRVRTPNGQNPKRP